MKTLKVTFKRPFFIDGYRFKAGAHDVPAELAARLPKDAKVAAEKEPRDKALSGIALDGLSKAKGYRLAKKEIFVEGVPDPVKFHSAKAHAVRAFIFEDQHNRSIDDWNELREDERKAKIYAAAQSLAE